MGYVDESCPFCDASEVKVSFSTQGGNWKEHKYHVAAYCASCKATGPRTLIKIPNDEFVSRNAVEENPEFQKLALDSWNNRKRT